MPELSNVTTDLLDVRRRALEACGWRWVSAYAKSYLVSAEAADYFGEHPGLSWVAGKKYEAALIEHTFTSYAHLEMPKIESDPGIALQMLDAWCRAHGYRWYLSNYTDCYLCRLLHNDAKSATESIFAEAETPALSIALALISAGGKA